MFVVKIIYLGNYFFFCCMYELWIIYLIIVMYVLRLKSIYLNFYFLKYKLVINLDVFE